MASQRKLRNYSKYLTDVSCGPNLAHTFYIQQVIPTAPNLSPVL